jgi:trans-aconitate methyltransferase
MYEDMGDLQQAQYFRTMYDKMVKQYPLRKSGVRALSVPRL